MSGIAHAVGKVFHGIGHGIVSVWHKIWKPLVIAAAVYFTGGLALGAMGAMSAGGSVLAGAGAGLSAAAGGIGIGAGAGIGGAFAAGAGTAAGLAVDAGAAGLTTAAATDAAIGAGGDVAVGAGISGTAAADASAGLDGALTAAGGDAAASVGVADAAGSPIAASLGEDATSQAAADMGQQGLTNISDVAAGNAAPIQSLGGMSTSSAWAGALNTTKSILQFPGVMQGISGLLNGYQQGQMYNQQLKWMQAHAPGQITGGVKNAFGGFAMNQNLQQQPPGPPQHLIPAAGGPVPGYAPQGTGNPAPGAPGVFGQPTNQPPYAPGMNSPSAESYGLMGYGMPGYGVQNMQPTIPQMQNQYYQQMAQQGLLGDPYEQQPFMDAPGEQTQPYYG